MSSANLVKVRHLVFQEIWPTGACGTLNQTMALFNVCLPKYSTITSMPWCQFRHKSPDKTIHQEVQTVVIESNPNYTVTTSSLAKRGENTDF